MQEHQDNYDIKTDAPTEKRSLFKPRTRKPSLVLAVVVNSFRLLIILILVLGLAGAGAIVGIARGYADTAPNLDLEKIDAQAQTSFFYDRQGRLITDYKGTENRVMVSLNTIPYQLRHAFVAVEDARFYSHRGIDIKRIAGAFLKNFASGSQQGGSTITQQLIKNTLLSNEQSYKRKIQEAYLAMQLEVKYTKDEILESYLNTIYLGENYYGVKVAATGYFGKELHELTLRECAMLAGMTTNPTYYNCRRNLYQRQAGGTDYVAITNNRTNYVLRMMYQNQFITHSQYTEALNQATAQVLKDDPEAKSLYPYVHYVEYAVKDVVQVLLGVKGLENTAANRAQMERELRRGGYRVYLALDTDIQTQVEQTLYGYKDYPKLRDPADSVFRSRNKDGTYEEIIQPQAAAAVIDYRTGELMAIVGSRTPPTMKKTLNRATDMNMPVGSSIKPLGVYAPAIDMGAGAGAIVYNMPLPIAGWRGSDGKDGWPKNYGGSSYRGPETLRTALSKSDNTAAAQALMTLVGVDRSYDYLLRLGIAPERINKTPFGLALGSTGATPLEMATAFGVLANGGVYQKPLSILGIVDRNGKVMYDAHKSQDRRQVFKPSAAWLTVDILKTAVKSGTGGSAQIKGQTVAGKTGTNSDQKGVFFAGMTGWYSAAVWIGHDNYKALSSKTTGGNAAAKLWQSVMSTIHSTKGLENRDILNGDPERDYGLVKVETCGVSGQLATAACREDALGHGTNVDWWPRESVPQVSCQMHQVLDLCTVSNMLAGPYCPPETRAQKGVVILPSGHPLQNALGTQYESVLTEYLGPYANLRFTGDMQQLGNLPTCNIHTADFQGGDVVGSQDSLVINTLMPDAYQLRDAAGTVLASLPPEHPAYNQLNEAINMLSNVLSQNPDAGTLAAAMAQLTAAMALAR